MLTTIDLAGGVLTIDGTGVRDVVTVQYTDDVKNQIAVEAKGFGDETGLTKTSVTANVTRIDVNTLGGHDTVDLSGVAIPAIVNAGPGDDIITTGSESA